MNECLKEKQRQRSWGSKSLDDSYVTEGSAFCQSFASKGGRVQDELNNLVELDFLLKNSAMFRLVRALKRITRTNA